MAKKTRIEDIDSEAVINSFRLDDTSIPPEARSTDGNAPVPPPKEAIQEAVSPPASHSKEEPERRRRNSKPEKLDYDTVFICGSNITAFLDNVLTHHFTLFQDEIAESFKRHMESYNL